MVFWALSGGIKVDYVTVPFKGILIIQCSNRVLIQGIDQQSTLDAFFYSMIQERMWSKHKDVSLNISKKCFQQ